MRPLRRSEHETRVEMMPLIDVVFLLLTFFIYAMVLMVRAEVLPVPLESKHQRNLAFHFRSRLQFTDIYVNKTRQADVRIGGL